MRLRLMMIFILMIILNGCADSLQKPSGLDFSATNHSEHHTALQIKPSVTITKADDQPKKHHEDKIETKLKQEETSQQTVVKEKNAADAQPVQESKQTTKKPETKQGKLPTKQVQQNQTSQKKTKQPKQTPQNEQKNDTKSDDSIGTVTMVIKISNDNIPLAHTNVTIYKNDTALDALLRITKDRNIQRDISGKGSTAYIRGIANVYEMDYGPGSGWMFRVNGVFAHQSAGAIKVSPGDHIEWLYTKDLGKDIGAR